MGKGKSRKILSDLQRLLIEYDDLPRKYLYSQYGKFLTGKKEIFMSISGRRMKSRNLGSGWTEEVKRV